MGRSILIDRLFDMKRYALLVIVMIAGISEIGCAEGSRMREGGPPPAAIEACAARMFREVCSFVDGQTEIVGNCQERAGQWVCVPDRHPPDRQQGRSDGHDIGPPPGSPESRGASAVSGAVVSGSAASAQGLSMRRAPVPPQEAFDACADKVSGTECLVMTPRGDIPGACAYSDQRLACIPNNPPPEPRP